MVARFHGRKGRPWRTVQARVFAEETHCCLCGRYVDQTIPNVRHRRARSVHHLIPPDIAPELANDRDNLRLAHFGCNAKAGRGVFKGTAHSGTHATAVGWATQGQPALPRMPWASGHSVVTVTQRDRDW